MWPIFDFLKEIIALWCQLHWPLYQENLNVHSWMIFCPDGIIPDSGITEPNKTYIYIYIYRERERERESETEIFLAIITF